MSLVAFGRKIIQTSSLDEMQVFFSDGHISAKNNVDVQLFDVLLDAHAFICIHDIFRGTHFATPLAVDVLVELALPPVSSYFPLVRRVRQSACAVSSFCSIVQHVACVSR